jgi:putative copper export protein
MGRSCRRRHRFVCEFPFAHRPCAPAGIGGVAGRAFAADYLVFHQPRRRENEPEAIVRRFSAISLGAVVILAAGGLLNTLFMVKRLADLYATTYGQILTGKIILFLIMIGLGVQNRRLLRIQRSSETQSMGYSATGRLFRNIFVESVLTFIVFGLVGALGAIEQPD